MRLSSVFAAGLLSLAATGATIAAPIAGETAAQASSADVRAFKIGALDAYALRDGDITVPNDAKTVGVGQAPAATSALLAAAGWPTDTVSFSIQPLLVRTGGRLVLFDTGAGRASFAVAGRLLTSLRSAGFEPDQVTDIFISHGHPDHLGGLLTGGGALAFPKATIHLSAPEWVSIKADAGLADLVRAIASKVATFEPGETIAPGVTAVGLYGHTPGHAGADIASKGEHLLYIGDTLHQSIISVQRPDWPIAFDVDAKAGEAARLALLPRLADANLRVYAVHFPFPGLGHVQRQGDGFVWVPEK